MSDAAKRQPGWQQPAMPPKRPTCAHLGLLFATLTLASHQTGDEWVCTCGKGFVVVSDGGRNKQFVADWRQSRPVAAVVESEEATK